jgi:hypothetical protein
MYQHTPIATENLITCLMAESCTWGLHRRVAPLPCACPGISSSKLQDVGICNLAVCGACLVRLLIFTSEKGRQAIGCLKTDAGFH